MIDFGGEVISRSGPAKEPSSLVVERKKLKSTLNESAKWDRSFAVLLAIVGELQFPGPK